MLLLVREERKAVDGQSFEVSLKAYPRRLPRLGPVGVDFGGVGSP